MYSNSIVAAISYVEKDDAEELAQLVDPYDTFEAFYTPAIRRIHRSISQSESVSQARWGRPAMPTTVVVQHTARHNLLAHRSGGEHAGGKRISEPCSPISAHTLWLARVSAEDEPHQNSHLAHVSIWPVSVQRQCCDRCRLAVAHQKSRLLARARCAVPQHDRLCLQPRR